MEDGRISPIFETPSRKNDTPKMLRNGDPEHTGRYKIHRIRLCRVASCIVTNVVSPSCVWVKLTNHITEQLQITDMSCLEPQPQSDISEGVYVMAPLDKNLYARARIVQLALVGERNQKSALQETTPNFVKVLFIDEGTTSWVSKECLARMHELLTYHPWQAIAVALFKIRPKHGTEWSAEVCETLRKILNAYPMVNISVAQCTKPSNNYRDIIKVSMTGINHEKDSLGSSIAHLLSLKCRNILLDRDMFDGCEQKIYPVSSDVKNVSDAAAIPLEPWKHHFPIEKDTRNGTSAEMEQQQPNEEQHSESLQNGFNQGIIIIDSAWLKAEGYMKDDNECIVNVEGRCTISPYEFYARPLRVKSDHGMNNNDEEESNGNGNGSGDGNNNIHECEAQMDAMISANDEMLKLADELNSFYGHPANRKAISLDEVKDALEQGRSAYGVAEVDGDVARFIGCWQRVEIIGLKAIEKLDEYYCRVRFLDSGGTDIRLLSSVNKISPVHCQRAPLCLQLCLHGVEPVNGDEWSAAARDWFYHELREDVPISVRVIGALNRRQEPIRLSYNSTAYRRSNVIYVTNIEVLDGSDSVESLDSRLVRQGYAVWSKNSPA